jgi:xylulokinase
LDADGKVLAQAGARVEVSRRHSGWSEQDPADWWQACLSALGQLRTNNPQAWVRVGCIGLSGQMHGAVLLDAADQVLYPAILWDDSRAVLQAAQLNEARSPAVWPWPA